MPRNRPNYRQERMAQARQDLAAVTQIPADCHRTMSKHGDNSLTADQEARASEAIWAAAMQLRMSRPEPKAEPCELRQYDTISRNGQLIGAKAR
jgi:hypothetical protein